MTGCLVLGRRRFHRWAQEQGQELAAVLPAVAVPVVEVPLAEVEVPLAAVARPVAMVPVAARAARVLVEAAAVEVQAGPLAALAVVAPEPVAALWARCPRPETFRRARRVSAPETPTRYARTR